MADIQKQILDEGKKFISKPENQAMLKTYGLKAWNWIKNKFKK